MVPSPFSSRVTSKSPSSSQSRKLGHPSPSRSVVVVMLHALPVPLFSSSVLMVSPSSSVSRKSETPSLSRSTLYGSSL